MKQSPKKNKSIDPDVMSFIDKMGHFYESFGLSKIGGLITGLLLTANEPLSPEDIASILKVSRSSVSTNMKVLTIMGSVETVNIRGDRKVYYTFSKRAFEQSLMVKINSYVPLKGLIEDGIRHLKKKNLPSSNLEMLKEWITLEKENDESLLKKWKSLTKKWELN